MRIMTWYEDYSTVQGLQCSLRITVRGLCVCTRITPRIYKDYTEDYGDYEDYNPHCNPCNPGGNSQQEK